MNLFFVQRLPLIALPEILRDQLVLVALGDRWISPPLLSQCGAKDQLFVGDFPNSQAERQGPRVVQKFTRVANVRTNNCTVAVLHGRSIFALWDKRKFGKFRHILVPCQPTALAALPSLLRYGKRGNLRVIGRTAIVTEHGEKRYIVIQVNLPSKDLRRQYGPTGLSPLELMRQLSGLRYVALRWSELMESGEHEGDIDLLIDQPSLVQLHERYNRQIATYPLDVYTDDGQGGYHFKSVPYYTAPLAKNILDSATESAAGIRVAAPYWRFLGFCYHLTFHNKSERVTPGTQVIEESTFHKPHYYRELKRLAALAGLDVPRTFDDIETLLKSAGVMPSLDLIGFYSRKNAFLKARYFERTDVKVGLATFFIRDFGYGLAPVDEIRKRLAQTFTILREGSLTTENRDRVLEGVRGGNWADSLAPGGRAEPVYWFVCWDPNPRPLTAKTKRKHPRLDNENIRLKDLLREEFGGKNAKSLRIIHSSDNSLEALDHLTHLGLENDESIASLMR